MCDRHFLTLSPLPHCHLISDVIALQRGQYVPWCPAVGPDYAAAVADPASVAFDPDKFVSARHKYAAFR
jgi:hypothetical protein